MVILANHDHGIHTDPSWVNVIDTDIMVINGDKDAGDISASGPTVPSW